MSCLFRVATIMTKPLLSTRLQNGVQHNKEKLRVYFSVESLAGLGHFNRAGLLVEAMHAAGMEVTVGSGTFVDEERFFPHARRVDLPTYIHRDKKERLTYWDYQTGQKKEVLSGFDMQKWKQSRAQAHREIVREVKPHIVIVEFWPFSRRNLTHEVESMRHEAKRHNDRTMLISSVRDVVKGDVRELKGNKVARQGINDASIIQKLRKVDGIIIHGDPRLVGLDKSFTELRHIVDKSYYSGYVVAAIPERDAAMPDNERPVLVHVGSGSNGKDFLIAAAKAWQHASEELRSRTWHFVTGPRFPDSGWKSLTTIVRDLGRTHVSEEGAPYLPAQGQEPPRFVIERYRQDLVPLIVNSAVSVSYAGYNTTQEVLASGVHALLVPKLKCRTEGGVWFDPEQAHRLDVLNSENLAHTLKAKDAIKPHKLATAIDRAYQTLPASNKPIDFNGASKTASLIENLYHLHCHKPQPVEKLAFSVTANM